MQQIWLKKGFILKRLKSNNLLRHHLGPATIYKVESNVIKFFLSCRDKKNQSFIVYVKYNLDTKKYFLKKIYSPNKKNNLEKNGASYPMVIDENNYKYLFFVGWSLNEKNGFNNHLLINKNKELKFNNLRSSKVFKKSMIGSGSNFIMKIKKTYYMWFTSFEKIEKEKYNLKYRYIIKLAKSNDFKNWIINPTKCINFKNQNEIAISKPSVIFKNGKFHMWYCYRGKYYKIGYATSKNGIDWIRKDKKIKIKGKKYNWDNQSMCYPSVSYLNNKKLIMIYSGNNYGKDSIGLCEIKIKDL